MNNLLHLHMEARSMAGMCRVVCPAPLMAVMEDLKKRNTGGSTTKQSIC